MNFLLPMTDTVTSKNIDFRLEWPCVCTPKGNRCTHYVHGPDTGLSAGLG